MQLQRQRSGFDNAAMRMNQYPLVCWSINWNCHNCHHSCLLALKLLLGPKRSQIQRPVSKEAVSILKKTCRGSSNWGREFIRLPAMNDRRSLCSESWRFPCYWTFALFRRAVEFQMESISTPEDELFGLWLMEKQQIKVSIGWMFWQWRKESVLQLFLWLSMSVPIYFL